jgi:hypothetical protein
MKTRQGFVSNSSSSSFVLLGFIPSKEENKLLESKSEENEFEDLYEYLEENDFYRIGDGDWEGSIGKFISDIASDGDGDAEEFTIDDLNKWADEIADFFKVDKSRIKLYTGIRSC